MATTTLPDHGARIESIQEKLFAAARGTFDLATLYVGDRMGWYRALAEHGALTSTELAVHTDTHERYVREWLEQQAVAGFLDLTEASDDPTRRRFALHPACAEVILDDRSLHFAGCLGRLVAAAFGPLEQVLDVYRTGEGLTFADYGHDMCQGQSQMNKPMFLSLLGQEWLPAVPDVHRRLLDGDGARVADVGCGTAWSAIGMAKAYPRVTVDGYDLDAHSIEHGVENVRAEGVEDRVSLTVTDAATVDGAGSYDLVTAFECVHDMSRPVDVLRAMRRLVKSDGSVIVMDEKVADAFDPHAGGFEWFFYGFSVLHCLPVGMAGDDPAGTGTVMRTSTFTRYAKEAGFTDCQVLPIQHDLFRFYRLRP